MLTCFIRFADSVADHIQYYAAAAPALVVMLLVKLITFIAVPGVTLVDIFMRSVTNLLAESLVAISTC